MTDREILVRLLVQIEKVEQAEKAWYDTRGTVAKADAMTEWRRAQTELRRMAGIVRKHLNIEV